MAIRVSATEVKEVIATSISDGVVLSSMITTASNYIDVHLPDAGHSAATLKSIELYLSAHLVAVTEERGGLKYSKLGDASDAWDVSKFGDGFKSTRFGQTALALDTSGILARIASSNFKAELRVVL